MRKVDIQENKQTGQPNSPNNVTSPKIFKKTKEFLKTKKKKLNTSKSEKVINPLSDEDYDSQSNSDDEYIPKQNKVTVSSVPVKKVSLIGVRPPPPLPNRSTENLPADAYHSEFFVIPPFNRELHNEEIEIASELMQKKTMLNETTVKSVKPISTENSSTNTQKDLINKNESTLTVFESISKGDLNALRYWIEEKKFNINIRDLKNNSLLHLTAMYGYLDIVKYLIEEKYISLDIKGNNRSYTPVDLAAKYGHLDILKYLIEKKSMRLNVKRYMNGYSPLELAARHGHLAIIKYLIEEQIVYDLKVSDGWTPLHEAVSHGHLNIVKYLIEEIGMMLDVKMYTGYTPLRIAKDYGYLEIVDYLIEKKGMVLDKKNSKSKDKNINTNHGQDHVASIDDEKNKLIKKCSETTFQTYENFCESQNSQLENICYRDYLIQFFKENSVEIMNCIKLNINWTMILNKIPSCSAINEDLMIDALQESIDSQTFYDQLMTYASFLHKNLYAVLLSYDDIKVEQQTFVMKNEIVRRIVENVLKIFGKSKTSVSTHYMQIVYTWTFKNTNGETLNWLQKLNHEELDDFSQLRQTRLEFFENNLKIIRDIITSHMRDRTLRVALKYLQGFNDVLAVFLDEKIFEEKGNHYYSFTEKVRLLEKIIDEFSENLDYLQIDAKIKEQLCKTLINEIKNKFKLEFNSGKVLCINVLELYQSRLQEFYKTLLIFGETPQIPKKEFFDLQNAIIFMKKALDGVSLDFGQYYLDGFTKVWEILKFVLSKDECEELSFNHQDDLVLAMKTRSLSELLSENQHQDYLDKVRENINAKINKITDHVNYPGRFFIAVKCNDVVSVKKLLESHQELLTLTNSKGKMALHLAAKFGHIEIFLELISAGLNYKTMNNKNKTAYDLAKKYGQNNILMLYHNERELKSIYSKEKEKIVEKTHKVSHTLSQGVFRINRERKFYKVQNNDQWLEPQPVNNDGNCGYTAFGIMRDDAFTLLSNNITQIQHLIVPAIQEQLVAEDFIQYLQEQRTLSADLLKDFSSYQTAAKEKGMLDPVMNNLYHHAKDPTVIQSYLNYDVKDRKVDNGWAHPCILQALAHIQGLRLYIWKLNDHDELIPHPQYPFYGEHGSYTHLLFKNGNHFERLEDYQGVVTSQFKSTELTGSTMTIL